MYINIYNVYKRGKNILSDNIIKSINILKDEEELKEVILYLIHIFEWLSIRREKIINTYIKYRIKN